MGDRNLQDLSAFHAAGSAERHFAFRNQGVQLVRSRASVVVVKIGDDGSSVDGTIDGLLRGDERHVVLGLILHRVSNRLIHFNVELVGLHRIIPQLLNRRLDDLLPSKVIDLCHL